ncbi:TPA: hypothetical protein DCY65_04080 [Candidatus Acetothermia bacterium]|nr:hypothetical protein [Candidatus Acetothermia bacterium]HAZ30730.1 hypothetical protein [Candidatus Acetothermia bacterium]
MLSLGMTALVAATGLGQTFFLPDVQAGWAVPDGAPRGRVPTAEIRVTVTGMGTFAVDPREVRTLRPDVFQEGHLSAFDLVAHLGEQGKIGLVYRYDEGMATHVIESINGQDGWWYEAHYAGGRFEANQVRMDTFPVKDGTGVRLFREDPPRLAGIHASFAQEVERLRANGDRVILPQVTIRGPQWTLTFRDVEVRAHGVRSDLFQPDVVTALDVLLSLGEQGRLTRLKLAWYAGIGRATPVDSYFVELIAGGGHSAEALGRCGFVYAVGDLDLKRTRGSMVHISSDARPLVSPEYMEWSWRCL